MREPRIKSRAWRNRQVRLRQFAQLRRMPVIVGQDQIQIVSHHFEHLRRVTHDIEGDDGACALAVCNAHLHWCGNFAVKILAALEAHPFERTGNGRGCAVCGCRIAARKRDRLPGGNIRCDRNRGKGGSRWRFSGVHVHTVVVRQHEPERNKKGACSSHKKQSTHPLTLRASEHELIV